MDKLIKKIACNHLEVEIVLGVDVESAHDLVTEEVGVGAGDEQLGVDRFQLQEIVAVFSSRRFSEQSFNVEPKIFECQNVEKLSKNLEIILPLLTALAVSLPT
jgi:glutamine phosphoribosylpyrophosphate amidotransferase